MNTFPRSTCRWSRAAGALGLAVVVLAFVCAPQAPKPADGSGDLPPFLEDFNARKEPAIVTKAVTFPSGAGPVRGFWARQEVKEPLPAVLLIYDEEPWAAWMKENARHLSGIGYGVLLLDVHSRRLAASKSADAFTDEATLAELTAAVRWLRSRPDVLPNHLGVVGWGWSGGQGLALAAATSLQACVVCESPLPEEPGLILGLRGTPLLGVFGGEDPAARKALPAFRKALAAAQVPCKFRIAAGAGAGFMGPPDRKAYAHHPAEEAWVEIYEFLGKHVEDARPNAPAGQPGAGPKPVATIADLMLAVNGPAGVRGALGRALEQEPANAKQWDQVRANAALIAESGSWLETRTPAKGPPAHWKAQAKAFTAAAAAVVAAADRHDYAATRRGLQQLAAQCAACHNEHR